MDPLTIAVTAATVAQHCIRVSSYLYSFINSGNNIDATVTVLRNEVDSLRQILAAIADSCRQPEIAQASQNEQETVHWRNLKQALDDCESALGLLEGRLEGIQSIKAKAGLRFVKFISKKVKWESTSQDLFRIRQQISSCREAMGLSLQWITLYTSTTMANNLVRPSSQTQILSRQYRRDSTCLQSNCTTNFAYFKVGQRLPFYPRTLLEPFLYLSIWKHTSVPRLVSSALPAREVSSVQYCLLLAPRLSSNIRSADRRFLLSRRTPYVGIKKNPSRGYWSLPFPTPIASPCSANRCHRKNNK